MTTLRAATEAARIYRQTQPAIDEIKDLVAANTAAKKVLGEYMLAMGLDLFRGVTLRVVPSTGWESDKLYLLLGKRVSEFRGSFTKKYFGLATRAKRAKA